MQPVLVSACLLGAPVRFDGGSKARPSSILDRWRAEGRVVSACPEVEGGLGVPRPPAELQGGSGGAVRLGRARVVANDGRDVSAAFVAGAERALAMAVEAGCRVAVLKARSPSCGSDGIYDGSFSGVVVPGEGVTAALLRANGIAVFSEESLEAADAALRALDGA